MRTTDPFSSGDKRKTSRAGKWSHFCPTVAHSRTSRSWVQRGDEREQGDSPVRRILTNIREQSYETRGVTPPSLDPSNYCFDTFPSGNPDDRLSNLGGPPRFKILDTSIGIRKLSFGVRKNTRPEGRIEQRFLGEGGRVRRHIRQKRKHTHL